jgi:hypothetical protein
MALCGSGIYDALPPGSIRLLTLGPGDESAELQCHLTPISLISPESKPSASTPYDALSYTWGEPVFPRRIMCHGLAIHITQNLFRISPAAKTRRGACLVDRRFVHKPARQ